ncbi:dihydrodipicolinate synthase family protein [Ruania alba]|uniref:4-hydroxy-tetrahydrodipicolinate synthase n=1 Tax=Ruania alba TaxID=648782 RepID=A0A1H5KSU8_9MICO|nr:dihydrodipicolinate synthase family protein [Ruania alba]SEE67823.1 4-hydroxy-tetrahydrodipicolinate synthase [Ruania alba]
MSVALDGVTAVLVTGYQGGTDRVDTEKVAALAARVSAGGVPVLTALGNTAEVQQLEDAERHAVLQAVAGAGHSGTLIAGVTGPMTGVLRQVETAAALGYHAAMIHEPSDPFGDGDGLVRFYTHLARQSALPIVLYLRSTRLSGAQLRFLAEQDRVVGVKYARPDLHTLGTLLRAGAGSACTWINGLAEWNSPAFAGIGVTSFTSGIANARPEIALAMHRGLVSGDLPAVHRLIDKYVGTVEALRAEGAGRYNVSVIKQLLRWEGLEMGGVRPPHSNLDEAALARLAEIRDYPAAVAATGPARAKETRP